MAPDDTPFHNGAVTNSAAANDANGVHNDVPPEPPRSQGSQHGIDLHIRKSSLLSRGSSFCMPKQRVQYPDFPEFDLSSTEVAELEEFLHRYPVISTYVVQHNS